MPRKPLDPLTPEELAQFMESLRRDGFGHAKLPLPLRPEKEKPLDRYRREKREEKEQYERELAEEAAENREWERQQKVAAKKKADAQTESYQRKQKKWAAMREARDAKALAQHKWTLSANRLRFCSKLKLDRMEDSPFVRKARRWHCVKCGATLTRLRLGKPKDWLRDPQHRTQEKIWFTPLGDVHHRVKIVPECTGLPAWYTSNVPIAA